MKTNRQSFGSRLFPVVVEILVNLCRLYTCLALISSASGAVWRNPRTGAIFENDTAAFGKADQTNPPPRNAILFLGASSMRLWKTLAEDLPEYRVINRAFGGSQITDVIHYMDRVVLPYSPPVIVYNPGADGGNPAETVLTDFKAFVSKVHSNLPTTHIVALSISAQPAQKALDRVREANRLIKEFASTEPRLSFIDAFSEMLDPDGRPRPELFLKDGRHLNERGYALWTKLIRKHLAGIDAASAARKGPTIKNRPEQGASKGAAVTRSSSSLPYWAELKRQSHLTGR
jgi:lysophospholipase L1-like esterase